MPATLRTRLDVRDDEASQLGILYRITDYICLAGACMAYTFITCVAAFLSRLLDMANTTVTVPFNQEYVPSFFLPPRTL